MNNNKDKLVHDLISEIERDTAWLTRDEQEMLRNKLEAWNTLVDEIYYSKGRKQ